MHTIQLCQKQLKRNLASVNLKLEKLNYLLSSTKIFCISVLNVGDCLARCLTFRPFLKLDP